MTTRNKNFRIRYADRCGNVLFITRTDGKIQHFTGSEQSHALSNVAGDKAAELRFALQDARDGTEALKHVRALAQFANPPTITLL